jgi:Zn-dependent protease
MEETIRNIVLLLVPMILSLTVHEWAHAFVAWRLGDDTAARQGRLTLNPVPHIDPIGTLLIPVVGSLAPGGFSLIGWARPVPVSPHRFHRGVTMRRGMILTAVAGPLSNIIMALVIGLLAVAVLGDVIAVIRNSLGIGPSMAFFMLGNSKFIAQNSAALATVGFDSKFQIVMAVLLSRMFLLNIGLAVFNMLPVPPLDGSRLLPEAAQMKAQQYQMFIFIGLLVLINIAGPVLSTVVFAAGDFLLNIWLALLGGAIGG